jgi:hypothetical protein
VRFPDVDDFEDFGAAVLGELDSLHGILPF